MQQLGDGANVAQEPFKVREFLEKQLAMVEVSNQLCPQEPVGENETVLGIMDDEMKRLWCLMRRMTDEANTMHEEICTGDGHTDEFLRLYGLAKYLHLYFSIEVSARFAAWGEELNLDIREGWQVVASLRHEEPDLDPFRRMSGTMIIVRMG